MQFFYSDFFFHKIWQGCMTILIGVSKNSVCYSNLHHKQFNLCQHQELNSSNALAVLSWLTYVFFKTLIIFQERQKPSLLKHEQLRKELMCYQMLLKQVEVLRWEIFVHLIACDYITYWHGYHRKQETSFNSLCCSDFRCIDKAVDLYSIHCLAIVQLC